ncbi:hypothetical protein EC968_009945 [Mortierella alpina]|nr:hypothetical protein EC968_009945 [Mortierella alpina]
MGRYLVRFQSADGTFLPPPPPMLSKELQLVLRTTAYSTLTNSLDLNLRKRAMVLLTLQANSLEIYQHHLNAAASASNSERTFQEVQQVIQTNTERNQSNASSGKICLDMTETQRQPSMEMPVQQNNELPPRHPELQVESPSVVIHKQILELYDKEQKFHTLQTLIRQLQHRQPTPKLRTGMQNKKLELPCQEGDHWQLHVSDELSKELTEALKELLQELSLILAADELTKLVDGFENQEEYIELYTTKISKIQGWTASRQIHSQFAKLLATPSSPHDEEEDVDSRSLTPKQVMTRFVRSYRIFEVDTTDSDIPWDRDSPEDEQLLIQFLERLPSDGLQVLSSNKFSFCNRALLELFTSSTKYLPGLRCLSMYRNDATVVNTQMVFSDWYREDQLNVDPFTAEIDWFLHRCPVQLQTLRVAIAGVLEPMHSRVAEQRSRAIWNRSLPKLPMTAIKHLYLEGHLALSSQPEFLARCPDLQSLSLSCTNAYPVQNLAPMLVHCPKIEDLAISSPSRPEDNMTQCILAVMRELAPSSTTAPWAPLASIGATTSSRIERTGLKRLRLENLHVTQAGILEALQLCASTLTHLAIRDCLSHPLAGPLFTPETSPLIFSFNRILETFTQLQEVDVMYTPKACLHPFMKTRSVIFDARDLVDLKRLAQQHKNGLPQAWACSRTLKVLRIEISGIARSPPPCVRLINIRRGVTSTATTSGSSSTPASSSVAAGVAAAAQRGVGGPVPELIKEGYRLQRMVCQLLGTLSSLEELCLGMLNVPGDDRPPALPGLAQCTGGGPESYCTAAGIQTQCLELSLSTGLELMSGMKEMRVLKVGGLEHRIGLGEIQWMCEQWPKLEAVYGLLRVKNRKQYDRYWEGKEEDEEMEREMVEWIRKNRPRLRYT